MRKNTASQVIGAQLVSASDGSAFTGSVTVSVTGDAGTQATGSVGSGACTHEGNGYHTYAPAQAETNYNLIAFTFIGTGAVPVTVQVFTTSLNVHDAVRGGMTALPNAAAGSENGSPVLDADGAISSKEFDKTGFSLSPAGILAIWHQLTSAVTTASTMGKLIVDYLNASISSRATPTNVSDAQTAIINAVPTAAQNAAATEIAMLDEGDATALLAAIAAKVEEFLINEGDATATIAAIATACNAAVVAGTVGSNVAAVKAKTDTIPVNPAAIGSAMTIADGAITAAKFDGSTAFPITSADSGSTQIARTGADADTLETLSGQIDSVSGQLSGLAGDQGSGANTIAPTVDDGTDPLESVKLRFTKGARSYIAESNASGEFTNPFLLDNGTWTVSATLPGYTFAQTTLIVSGDVSPTYSMTQIVSVPADAPLCLVTIPIVDQYGASLAGEPVEITFVKYSDTATVTPLVLTTTVLQTSDVDGQVEVNLLRLATYKIIYGNASYSRRLDITTPDAGTYAVEL